jgi:hypothetical protein
MTDRKLQAHSFSQYKFFLKNTQKTKGQSIKSDPQVRNNYQKKMTFLVVSTQRIQKKTKNFPIIGYIETSYLKNRKFLCFSESF